MTKIELHLDDATQINEAFLDAYTSFLTVRGYCMTGSYSLIPDTIYDKLLKKFGQPSTEWDNYIDNQLFILAAVCQQVENQVNEQNKGD